MSNIKKILTEIEEAPLSLAAFASSFTAIVLTRIVLENFLGGFALWTAMNNIIGFTFSFIEFLILFLVLTLILRFAGAPHFRAATNVMLFGFLVVLLPPIIDHFIGGVSIYLFASLREIGTLFITFFGSRTDFGITWGIRIETILAVIGIFAYALAKKRGILRSLASALAAYTLFFVIVTLPSWITLVTLSLTGEKSLLSIDRNDAVEMFLSPGHFFSLPAPALIDVLRFKMILIYIPVLIVLIAGILRFSYKEIFVALWKNARPPQLIYHNGLLFLGGALAIVFSGTQPLFSFFEILIIFALIAAVSSAWLASVIPNDIADQRIDRITNPTRPLPTNTIPPETYATIGWLFFAASILFSCFVSLAGAGLLLGYQVLAFLYSTPPLRLKRFPIIATGLASVTVLLILFIGFIALNPAGDLTALPPSFILFFFLVFFLALPLKDFKDIGGDRADGVWTIPILLGERFAKPIIGGLIFLLFLSSTFFIRSRAIFFPSILFGTAAFWAIQIATDRAKTKKGQWLTYHRLPGTILALVVLYGITIAQMLF